MPRTVNKVALNSVLSDMPVKLSAAPAKHVNTTASRALWGAFAASSTLCFSAPTFKSITKIGKARKF